MTSLVFPLRSVFLGLPLEGEAKRQFQALQEKLRDFEEEILRFQNPDQPHLTLQFWREIMEIEFQPMITQAERIVAKTAPFILRTTEAHTFGNRGEDRVLFIDIAFSEELARLRKLCPWPSEPADKPFHPHLTLARILHPQRFAVHKKDIMKQLRNVSFPIAVDRLRLYAEVDGRKQTPLQDFPFSGSLP